MCVCSASYIANTPSSAVHVASRFDAWTAFAKLLVEIARKQFVTLAESLDQRLCTSKEMPIS